MAAEATTAIPAVDIKRVFDATIGKVYAAWTNSEAVKAWFGPATCQVTAADFEPEVGRPFKITMDTPEYGEMSAIGSFLEVVPEARLKLAWNWEGNPDDWQTTLTVSFAEVSGKTEVRLHHEGFAEKESRNHHEEGWQGSLEKLAEQLG